MNSEITEEISKQLILCVLAENLDTLSILKNIDGWSEEEQTIVQYKSIEERYSQVEEESGLLSESKEKIDLVDFQKDCSFIESTLQKTFNEIRKCGTYKNLTTLTDIFKRILHDEKCFLEQTKEKEEEFVKLQNIYLTEQKQFLTKIEDTMKKIGMLKDEIEDFVQESKIKGKYVTNWGKAKTEMNTYKIINKEKQIEVNISKKHQDFDKEDRVHQEIKNIFNEIETDLQKEIKKWKLKYEHDLKIIIVKIKMLKEKKDSQQKQTAEMIKQKAIDEYKEYKAKKEEEQRKKERNNKAAVKIQSWWRGVMVRKGFGKYKKKKDKKGKKKASNEKRK